MRTLVASLLFALVAACADDLEQDDSRHHDEAKTATRDEAQSLLPTVRARIALALGDLRTGAKHQGGTEEPLYTFMDSSSCSAKGAYSGGGVLTYDDVDFQAIFTDCLDAAGSISLDGRVHYELEFSNATRSEERYVTDMTLGLTEPGSERVSGYIDCHSDLRLTTDGSTVTGSGKFCGTLVDESWSFST